MKYYGDKISISADIVSIINSYIISKNIEVYVEPFVGGANIIDKVICNKKIGNDIDKYIISLLQHMQNDGELPNELDAVTYNDCLAHYKNKDSKYNDWYLAAVGILGSNNNKLFNKGKFSKSYNDNKDYLIEQSKYLKDITFTCSDYRKLDIENSLIYIDAPRKSNSKTKFKIDELWEKAREWSKNNIVLVSEITTPDDFVEVWRENNDKSCEKLFIHQSHNELDDRLSSYDF